MRSHSKYLTNIGKYLDYAFAKQYFHITSEQEMTPDSGMHSIFLNICLHLGEGGVGWLVQLLHVTPFDFLHSCTRESFVIWLCVWHTHVPHLVGVAG